MIGTLARKRTQLGALAVLAGLVVALFAFTVSAQTGPRITSTTDSDFIIGDGGTITVSVTAPGAETYTFQPIFGFVLTGTVANGPAIYTHSAGAPQGEFTIRATAGTAGAAALTKTLTVGEPGTNLASVQVVLGTTNAAGDARGSTPPAADDKPETDTVQSGGNIFIEVVVKNSLGSASNVSSNLNLDVYAVGGSVASGDSPGTASSVAVTNATAATNPFVVTATTAGKVEVFATAAIGTTVVRTTESLFLNFSGGPDVISAGDVSGGLLAPATTGAVNTGFVSFEVTSVDAAGSANTATDTANTALQLDPSDLAPRSRTLTAKT